MSEKSENENTIRKHQKLLGTKIIDPELKSIDKVIQEYAPEISYLYKYREDETEGQQTKIGYLQENRILGIILKFYLEGKNKILTMEVGKEYKRFFKPIAHSTISSHLNMFIKNLILFKEKDGKNVNYTFNEEPPNKIRPFWFTRFFCIVPAYFSRVKYFSNLYNNAEKYIQQYYHNLSPKDKEILERNFKFITGLLIISILKNRSSSCASCQFGKTKVYKQIEEKIKVAIKDRSDTLPEDIVGNLVLKYSDLPMFNGISILEKITKEKITKELLLNAKVHRKDLEYQIMLAQRRKELRLRQTKIREKKKP
ncbi:MAG: hypothetical protein ACW98D_12290 [Promethearchaeota archaeon]